MKLVLVTGANGFVGGHMCEFLSGQGYSVRRAIRSVESYAPQSDDDVVSVGSISADTDWSTAVSGVDAVVHLAARVHVLSESSEDPLTAFREVNSLGTMRLAKQAAEAGVRRFVYMSSIKAGVAGELNSDDPYGQSKLEAEQELFRFAATEQLEPVVVRPPLVYGPGVGANFLRLLKIIELGVPLPFRSVENHRSLVAIENLCDFVAQCLDSDAAVGEVFDVSDGDTVSTP
jgi:nucleoside-diphosphate-sugar epimerase